MSPKNKPIFDAIVILVITISLIFSFIGCKCSSTSEKLFSEIDTRILKSAYSEYDSLRQTSSSKEAREELVLSLNSHKGVEEAHLGVDGYTIFVSYSDGDRAAVYTLESDEAYEQTVQSNSRNNTIYTSLSSPHFRPEGSPGILQGYSSSKKDSNTKLITYRVNTTAPQDKITPESRKVLVLGTNYWEWKVEPTMETIQLFKNYGWTDSDITAKLVIDENTDRENIKPEDYFNLQPYGIILFIGHGMSADHSFSADNAYLQFCYLDRDDYARIPELKIWQDQGKIVVTDVYSGPGVMTMIRADLLREKMGTLPYSYVYLGSCNGGFLDPAFLSNKAGAFLGWRSIAFDKYADANMKNMVAMMLEKGSSAQRAFGTIKTSYTSTAPNNPDNDDSMVRGLIPAYSGESGTYVYDPNRYFILSTDPSVVGTTTQFYLPSWINLKVAQLPVGTSRIKVSIADQFDVTRDYFADVSPGQTAVNVTSLASLCLPPKFRFFDVSAYNASGVLLKTSHPGFTSHAGSNDYSVQMSEYEYALSGSPDSLTPLSLTTQDPANQQFVEMFSSLNGKVWMGNAEPGDVLEIKVYWVEGWDYTPINEQATLGPIWLHSIATGKAIKITDGGNLTGTYDPKVGGGVDLMYSVSYTFPTEPTITPTSTTTTTTTSTITTITTSTTSTSPSASTQTTATSPTTTTTPGKGTPRGSNGFCYDGTYVWIANRGIDNVMKLNVSDGSILETYPVGKKPRRTCFDGTNIWVTNSGDNTVTKLRASDGQYVGVYKVGDEPGPICFDGTNIWVGNNTSNTIMKLNPSNGSIIATYEGFHAPGALCFDKNNIWAANFGSNTVVKIRPSDGAVVSTYTVGNAPSGICFDGTNIWVVNSKSNSLTKLSLDGRALGTYSVGKTPRNCCYDSKGYIWVTNSLDNSVTQLKASDGSYVRSYKAGIEPFDIADAGGYIWVTNIGSDDIIRIPITP